MTIVLKRNVIASEKCELNRPLIPVSGFVSLVQFVMALALLSASPGSAAPPGQRPKFGCYLDQENEGQRAARERYEAMSPEEKELVDEAERFDHPPEWGTLVLKEMRDNKVTGRFFISWAGHACSGALTGRVKANEYVFKNADETDDCIVKVSRKSDGSVELTSGESCSDSFGCGVRIGDPHYTFEAGDYHPNEERCLSETQ